MNFFSNRPGKSLSRIRLAITAYVFAGLLVQGSASAQVTVDGTLSAAEGYGISLAAQTINTGFGDNTSTNGTSGGGSELDALFGFATNGCLYLFISGNVQANGNNINIFISDGQAGGQQNAVKIAEILLQAGADVRAVAEIYGGSDTLGLAATSVYPFLAGVQESLMDVLVEHGANLNEERLVNACLANGRGRAAEHLAKRGARLDLEGAAGVGRLDLVKTCFNEDGSLRTNATPRQMELGFMWACEYGRTNVVEFLLKTGVKVDAMPHGETGLHWAAYAARVDIVVMLLEKKSPLDLRDKRHGSTPLEWALHGWSDPPLEAEPNHFDHYYKVVALLTAGGARMNSAWLDAGRGTKLTEKMRADPRMIAALSGETPTQ